MVRYKRGTCAKRRWPRRKWAGYRIVADGAQARPILAKTHSESDNCGARSVTATRRRSDQTRRAQSRVHHRSHSAAASLPPTTTLGARCSRPPILSPRSSIHRSRTMVHVRLNEKETNPNPHINFITPLKMMDPQGEEEARRLLRALAAQVRPIMKAEGFVVNSFEEASICFATCRVASSSNDVRSV